MIAFAPLRGLRAGVLMAAMVLSACRDSPAEVLSEASVAAAGGDLVAVQALFSFASKQRIKRRHELPDLDDSTPRTEEETWRDLCAKLTFDGRAIESSSEEIAGNYARVIARAGPEDRDYYLRKEDGAWRIEPGAGARFTREKRSVKGQASAPVDGEEDESPGAEDDGKKAGKTTESALE